MALYGPSGCTATSNHEEFQDLAADNVPETLEHVPDDEESQLNYNLEEEDMAFFSDEEGSITGDSDSDIPDRAENVEVSYDTYNLLVQFKKW